MKMEGMLVPAAVAKYQPVALTRMDDERFDFRPRLVVDGPGVKLGTALRTDVTERENECLIRCRRRGGVCELRVVPGCRRWIFPDGRPRLSGVLQHDSEARLARLLQGRTEDPNAGILHFHNSVHAFRHCQ